MHRWLPGYLAAAIEDELGEPVFPTGTSTGGSVALQLASDRPELVRALVVVPPAAPTWVIGGAKDIFYHRELFEPTAADVKDGRAHIYPDPGHVRTSTSTTTSHLTLGFLRAAQGQPRSRAAR